MLGLGLLLVESDNICQRIVDNLSKLRKISSKYYCKGCGEKITKQQIYKLSVNQHSLDEERII
jgi:hypothetical protein